MFYKKFEHYIIFCLLKQITMILYVSGRATPVDSDKTKLFTQEQLQILAEDVCLELSGDINVNMDTCKKRYWAPDTSMQICSSLVTIQCQMNDSIRLHITPSKNIQLVALVPHLSNDSDKRIPDVHLDSHLLRDLISLEISRYSRKSREVVNATLIHPEFQDSWFTIIYSIVYPMDDDSITLYRSSDRNYTLWSTTLKQGSPLQWQGGEKVPEYKQSTESRTYDIKRSLRPSLDGSAVFGQFTWNTSGDGDLCFDVVNSCLKSDGDSNKVWPNGKDNEPQIEFDHLSAEDECNITVKGRYGITKLTYYTLSCEEVKCPPKEIKPEMPNITVEAIKDSADTSEVYVGWPLPSLQPDSYTVTLVTMKYDNHTIVASGGATEVRFKNVTGEGIYHVLMQARLGNSTANTSRIAKFPDIWDEDGTERGARGAEGVGGVALGAGCAAAAALALICRCRRRRLHVPVSPYILDDKPLKDGDTEVLEIWRDTEDRWEVRADKLVLHEVIGEGAFGVVRRAMLAPNSVQVAVKMLKDFPSLDEIRSFRSEMELMKSVGVHPHLVSLVGCCTGRRPLIVAEYCSRGDLLSYLRCTWDVILSKRNAKYYNNNIDISDYRNDLFKCKARMESSKLVVNKLYELQEICDKELTALDLLSFCRQIAMGMEFLAANRVVHRDLAARNILVTADRTLKIADFGLSRDVYEENQYKQKGNGKMPVKWMALESLTRRIYTTQSDVWSFGVVVWEIATVGGAPYASVTGARMPRLLRSGYRMPKPNNCSPQLYDIMLSCWRTHPRERPTFAELHQRLDELLNSASAHQYLSLEIDADDAPPTPKHHRYIKMLMRGKRGWSRGETYERPLKAPHANHYTTLPDSLSAPPV